MVSMKSIKTLGAYVFLLILSLPAGTFCHEVIGHGIVGIICGGRITYVEILRFEVYPSFGWVAGSSFYGFCNVDGIPTERGNAAMALGGSLSTWCISAIAILLLWARPWRRWKRMVMVVLSLW